MQGFDPLHLPLSEYPPILLFETDTATPRSQIPMYYIHDLKQPFCRNFACQCHQPQREVARLLALINEGIMTLAEAATFMHDEEKEGDA